LIHLHIILAPASCRELALTDNMDALPRHGEFRVALQAVDKFRDDIIRLAVLILFDGVLDIIDVYSKIRRFKK